MADRWRPPAVVTATGALPSAEMHATASGTGEYLADDCCRCPQLGQRRRRSRQVHPRPPVLRAVREEWFHDLRRKKTVATATKCETGIDTDGSEAKLGIGAFEGHLGQRVILITITDA